MKWVLLTLSFGISTQLSGQHAILEVYENENHIGNISSSLYSILYFLEEGKKSEILDSNHYITQDFELPEDTIQLWACKFNDFNQANFISDTSLELITHKKTNKDNEFGTFEKVYLEILEDKSFRVKFYVKIIAYNGRIQEIIMTDKKRLESISPEKVISLFEKSVKATSMISLSDLPPPPPIPGEEEEKIRHEKAIEAFKCQ